MTGPNDLYGVNAYFPGRTTFEEVRAQLDADGSKLQEIRQLPRRLSRENLLSNHHTAN